MKQLSKVEIPKEIDGVIERAINRGAKRKRDIRYFGMSSALVVLLFVAGMNMSLSFAEVVSRIPVVGEVLSVFQFDKGLKRAEENGYVQNIGETVQLDGFNFTLDKAVADRKRIVVECTVEDLKGVFEDIDQNEITADIGIHGWSDLGWRGSYSSQDYNISVQKIGDNKYKIIKDLVLTRSQEMPKDILVELSALGIIEGYYEYDYVYRSPRNVNTLYKYGVRASLKEEFLGDFAQNNKKETIDFAGITFNIDEITISPASTSVILSEVGYGDKVILGKRDMFTITGRERKDEEEFWLEDEAGNKYNVIWSEIRTRYRKGGALKKYGYLELRFESAYYNKPEKLWIRGRSCVAEKEEGQIIVDIKNNKVYIEDLIKDAKIKEDIYIYPEEGRYRVDIDLSDSEFDFYRGYIDSLTQNGEDDNGKHYRTGLCLMSDYEYELIKNVSPDYQLVPEATLYCTFTGDPNVLEKEYFQRVQKITIPTRVKNLRYVENIDVKLFEKK